MFQQPLSATLLLAATLFLLPATAAAQDPSQPTPATASSALSTVFEVASVRPSNPNPDPTNPLSQIALMLPQPGGRFTATNTPLRMLIMAAHELQQDQQLVGGPAELLSAKYDITARVAGTATFPVKELPQLLRSLLADRFKLTTHTETRELPVYDLVLARGDGRLGPDMRPSQSDCANRSDEVATQQSAAVAKGDLASLTGKPGPCMITTDTSGGPLNLMMRGDGQEIKQLIEQLSVLTGRTVRDKTGLTGRYDFAMKMDIQMVLALAKRMGANIPAAAANIPSADGSSLMTALDEQLGLKLESARGAVPVVVIDSVQAPEAN
jgi:uncharacterized protein (TIGR03435 family)